MAVNFAFYGRWETEDNVPLASIYYTAYFQKVVAGSSSSKWMDAPRQANASAQWQFVLSDGDMLGMGGTAQEGDKVIVVAWTPGSDRTASGLTRASYIVIPITSSHSYYMGYVPVLNDRTPTAGVSVPASVERLTSMTLTNSSVDTGTVVDGAVTIYQGPTYDGQAMFAGSIGVDHCDIDWGDSQTSIATGAANAVHTYSALGGVTEIVSITATDIAGNTSGAATDTVNILWRAPVVGGSWGAAVAGTSSVFTPNITNLDGANTSALVTYTPDEGSEQADLSVTDPFVHEWATPGSHEVIQTISYYDGFATQEVHEHYPVTVTYAADPASTFPEVRPDVTTMEVMRGDSKSWTHVLGVDCTGWTPKMTIRIGTATGTAWIEARTLSWQEITEGSFIIFLDEADTLTEGRYIGEVELRYGTSRLTALVFELWIRADTVQ